MTRLSGFTLIEVMIALLIFSLGSVTLIWGMNQAVSTQSRLEQKTFASWIAENKFTELSIVSSFPPVGEKKEDIEYAGQTWVVQEKIIKTPNPFMRRVEITIFLLDQENNADNQVHSVTGFIGDL